MSLFNDLQKNTKTTQEIIQQQKNAEEEKRIDALNKKIEAIKTSVFEETNAAASKGIRKLTITPYYLYEFADSLYYSHMSFHTRPPYYGVKGHMYKTSEHSPWYDLYELKENSDEYGYILPQDRPYIISKTKDFLISEGFKDFYVEFETEYRNPNAKIFKFPTGRNILKINVSW